ncbi:MAG: hypothetical protein ACK5PS_16770 [Desulfopila sp.]
MDAWGDTVESVYPEMALFFLFLAVSEVLPCNIKYIIVIKFSSRLAWEEDIPFLERRWRREGPQVSRGKRSNDSRCMVRLQDGRKNQIHQ